MIFGHFLLDVNESNAFVVGCEETREALLVDAAAFSSRILRFLDKHRLTLTKVFITHDHYDHSGAVGEIMAKFSVTVYSGSGHAGGQSAHRVQDGDTVRIGRIEGRVVCMPGHTCESVGLVLPGMIFTGDALFAGSVGGTFSEGDQATEITAVREKVFCLPDDYLVHPGHGPSSTVGIEKHHNPFFV